MANSDRSHPEALDNDEEDDEPPPLPRPTMNGRMA